MKKLPLIMAHAGGDKYFQENSLEAIDYSNKLKPDIIELDIRKSKDDIIFCHHGKIPIGLIKAHFFRYKNFNSIKKNNLIFTLEEILKEITYNPILYLDIKDRSIKIKEIEKVLKKFKFNRVYLASYSKKYLVNAHKIFEKKYFYAYQHPIFFIKYFIRKYKGKIDMVKIMRWDKGHLTNLRQNGFQPKIYYSFYSRKRYLKDSVNLKSLYVCTGDINKIRILLKKLK